MAVTSSVALDDFLDWLNAEDDRQPGAAAQVPSWLRRVQARNPTARVGAATLDTSPD